MTGKQEAHVKRLKETFSEQMEAKYRAGQKEHGGDLWSVGPMQLLDFAIEEAIDQVVYLFTLKEELEKRDGHLHD